MEKLGTVHIAAALYWKKVVRILPLASKGSLFTENGTDSTEYAMQQSGTAPHIIDQTWSSIKHASLA